MNKTFSSLLLLTVLLLSACTSSPQKSSANYVVDLEERKKITLPIDERTYYLSRSIFQFERNGTEFLHFENSEKGQSEIVIFNIENQKIAQRIQLANSGPNAIYDIWGSIPYGDSDIIVFQNNAGIITITNNMGHVLKNFTPVLSNGHSMRTVVGSYYYNPPLIIDSLVYTSQEFIKSGLVKKEDWNKVHMFASMDLRTGETTYSSLFYPSIFENDVRDPAGGYSFTYDYNYKDKCLVCSFQGYDSLMVSSDFKTVKWYNGRSSYLPSLHPVLPESSDDIHALIRLREAPKYSHIMYDKYRDVYYRFAEHPYELSPDESPYVEPNGREFSVIVFNDQFEIIGETKFPGNKYFYKMSFVGRDGLYISENNEANPEFDENKLVFACFGLKDLE